MTKGKKRAAKANDKGKKKRPKIVAISASAQEREGRAKKEQITLRLDADVVDFFRAQGLGYQTKINDFMGIAMADAGMREAAETPGSPWYEENRTHEAMRDTLFRPKKEQITLRLDTELLDYFREKGKGYQSRMNRFLRLMMVEQLRGSEFQQDEG